MERRQGFDIVLISDSDEPEEAIVAGMAHTHFDGVMLALVPEGEQDEQSYYDTPETSDGRPTRPVLFFHKGFADAKHDGADYVAEMLEVSIGDVAIVEEWVRNERTITSNASKRTLVIHLAYPPYPWFEAAVIGMQQGNFDSLELVDWTEPDDTKPATYTYSFWDSGLVD